MHRYYFVVLQSVLFSFVGTAGFAAESNEDLDAGIRDDVAVAESGIETEKNEVSESNDAGPAVDDEEPVVVVDTEDVVTVVDEPEIAADDFDLSLDTVSIIGDRERLRKAVGSGHVVTEEELERFDYDDVHRVLTQTPGVYVRGEDGYGLRPNIGLRGANSDRSAKVTLMEDGILLTPAPYSAPAAYYFPLMSRISGVEVFKGPAAIRYGPNTIGGAINFQTRQIPRTASAAIDMGYGMENFGRLQGYAGTSGERWGVLFEGAHVQADGFKQLDGGGNTGFDKNEMLAKARYHTDPGGDLYHQFDARFGYATEISNETYLGLSDADFEATPYRRYISSQLGNMDWNRMQMRLGYYLAKEDAFDLQLVGYRHDFSRDWRKLNSFRGASLRDVLANPNEGQLAVFAAILRGEEDATSDDQVLNIGTNGRVFVSQGLNLTSHFRPNWGPLENDIEVGFRFHHDQIERTHTEDGYWMVQGELVQEERETQIVTSNKGSARSWAFHLYDEMTWSKLMFAPGFRFEWINTDFVNLLEGTSQDNLSIVLLPGAGFHYELTPWWGLLAGVHSGFSPVSPGQDKDVNPEQSINYEAGTRIALQKTQAEVIGFFNDYSNLTGECTFSSGCADQLLNQQFNGGRVHVYGVETVLEQELKGPWGMNFLGKALYTLTLSDFQSSFSSSNPQFGEVEEGDSLPYVPEHQGTFLGGIQWAAWEMNVSVNYTGQMRDVAGQGEIIDVERIDERWVTDLTSSIEVIDDLRLYLTINNLFDETYMVARRPFGARPGRPFQAFVGLKYHLGEN